MRWDTVIPLWLDRIEANSDVQSVLGAAGTNQRLYMAGERDFEPDSLEWQLVVPGIETEVWETAQVTLSFWVRSDLPSQSGLARLITLEAALRSELHHDLPITVGSVEMWSRLVGGSSLNGMEDGVLGHSLDFELEYLRAKWS